MNSQELLRYTGQLTSFPMNDNGTANDTIDES